MKLHLSRIAAGGALIALTVVAGMSGTATAATAEAANTLKISPLRTDISIEAGNSGKVKARVTNVTKSDILVRPIENDFIAGDEKGTPAIVLDAKKFAPSHSLKRFMTPLPDVLVPAGETREVEVTITVPKTAQAGGYFGAIRFASANETDGQSVNLSPSAASIILLTVPGDTIEQLNLTNFDIKQNDTVGGNFRNPENLNLFFRFENKGNVQLAPTGQYYIQKGDKVVYSVDFNQENPKATVLPDSARRWEVPLKNVGKFGKYKVGATFTYGKDNKTIQVSKTVWIIPTGLIFGVIGGVLLLIVIIAAIVTFLRSYKKRILKSSGRR